MLLTYTNVSVLIEWYVLGDVGCTCTNQDPTYQYQPRQQTPTTDEEEAAASMGPAARCHARVVRSLGKWSGGLAQTEVRV